MQRLILLAIASVMSLGFLGACGGGEAPVEEPATTEEVTPEATEEAPAEGEMEEMPAEGEEKPEGEKSE
ncbi:MAG: hypothetical protein HC799_18925 [Limnothrix sp. RL_2_0]|nr:hypothetical protein [Limnothrix sp. RL_2_0]